MRRIVIFLLLAAVLLLLATPALAMNSTHYAVDWLNPLTGTGVSASSPQYAVHLTVGQAAYGGQASTNYKTGLGFWYGRLVENMIYAPIVRR